MAKTITIELTDNEAWRIDKALGYMTLDEDIDEGQYQTSWLAVYRRINKKLRDAGANVEEA